MQLSAAFCYVHIFSSALFLKTLNLCSSHDVRDQVCIRVKWLRCHHGMARPQVADGGGGGLQISRLAASIADNQQRVALHLGGLFGG
jgi:hypothetical protein